MENNMLSDINYNVNEVGKLKLKFITLSYFINLNS